MTEYARDLSDHRLDKAKDILRTGLIDTAFSKIAHNAFDSRQVSDYQDFQMPTAGQAKAQYDDATQFIAEIDQKRTLFIQGELTLPHIS